MEIKILCPRWGQEDLPLFDFLDKIRAVGFDGMDAWIPKEKNEKKELRFYLEKHQMYLVAHQYEAEGSTFDKFRNSYLKNLYDCAELKPLLINSHTGRDYFSFQQNLALIDTAQEFSDRTGIEVAHETHRGRFGYSPQMISPFFVLGSEFSLTADFSHWVCVTESMLEHFAEILGEAIDRSIHIHARVGFEEGPQVSHPAAPEWKYAVDRFLEWWDRIVSANNHAGRKILTVTTEFGPEPYMPKAAFSVHPMVDQFEVNCYMKDLLANRYVAFR